MKTPRVRQDCAVLDKGHKNDQNFQRTVTIETVFNSYRIKTDGENSICVFMLEAI